MTNKHAQLTDILAMLLTLLSETQGFPGAADTFWATWQQIQILTSSKVTLLYKQEKKLYK